MTRRGLALAVTAAALVATSETVLYLQLRDTERARRRLAGWKRAHRCSSGDPVDGHFNSVPEGVRGG